MKKKYKFKFNITSLIISVFLTIILLIGIIVNLLTLTNLFGLSSSNLALDISAIVIMCIILASTLMITFLSHYTLTEKHFAYSLGFSWYKRDYSDILLFREHISKKMLLMYYKCVDKKGNELINYLTIQIKPTLFKDFIDSVKQFNSSIVYEVFDDNAKDEKTNKNEDK